MIRNKKIDGFKFKPFSKKQMKILTWWQDASPTSDRFMVIADGSIRSGKSISMCLSFLLFVMNTFNQLDAAMAGKTVGTLRRNLVNPLKKIAKTLGYEVTDHRSENYLEIKNGDVINNIWLFGGKDEASQDTVQGATLCAVLLDEVALMPESFYNQISGRLSIEGSKMFLNCNPGSPFHWFKRTVIDKALEKDALYVHFTMDDNLSLSEEIKERYKKQYSGVWSKRYIDGLWTASSGLVYDMFDKDINQIEPEDIPYECSLKYCIPVDYGTSNATVFLLMFLGNDGIMYVCKEYYFSGRAEAEESGNYDTQKTDLEFAEDAKTFVGENYNYTGLTYTQIPFIVDPAANSFKLQLRKMRFKTKNANNEVLDGIRDVASLMVQGKLKISTECPNLLQEIHTYSWDSKAQETAGIDKVLKKNDHCVDSLRYGCKYLTNKNSLKDTAIRVGI